jgi:polysaccharide pyruvyl transferase WcaK-like protein
LKLPVVLVPHQIYPKGVSYTQEEYQSWDGDDRYPVELIFSSIKNRSDLFALRQEMTPQELKGVIGESEIFIGARMHSVIAALSSTVPSLVIQYSHKSGGMMKLLGMDPYVWDIKDDFDKLTIKTFKLWNSRQKIRAELKGMMPAIFQGIYDLTNEIDVV